MNFDDYSLDSLFSDMPKVNQLGFFAASSLDLNPDYDEVVIVLNDLIKPDASFTDDEGYAWQIIAHTIDEENRRLAWVEWREKESGRISYENYYLKARDESGSLLMWNIETYNAYFGCTVGFLKWIENAVIFIYEDKHDTFAVNLRAGCDTKRVEISSAWEVKYHTLLYEKQTQDGTVTLKLPSLEEI